MCDVCVCVCVCASVCAKQMYISSFDNAITPSVSGVPQKARKKTFVRRWFGCDVVQCTILTETKMKIAIIIPTGTHIAGAAAHTLLVESSATDADFVNVFRLVIFSFIAILPRFAPLIQF